MTLSPSGELKGLFLYAALNAYTNFSRHISHQAEPAEDDAVRPVGVVGRRPAEIRDKPSRFIKDTKFKVAVLYS